ncbi:hypothetical protein KKD81_02155 [Patescibacteria group bacterium]|nr:hypothetical protein [Patescibacteria group bacterium]MBU2158958.1 hypothetical protein [Patescibacteria group bacterium]MBU2220720.1 hypothetical protein [Patescibacteria group bacterium]
MALVLESEVHKEPKLMVDDQGLGPLTWKSYMPLIVIFALLTAGALAATWKDFGLVNFVQAFMAGFFIVFAGFKLMDLKGFAEGYSTYDLLASRWTGYGYIYPFIELAFGLLMLAGFHSAGLLWVELAVMLFSGLGVVIKLAKGEEFMCACLGTFLKVPLTKITVLEDFGMAALAGLLLLLI